MTVLWYKSKIIFVMGDLKVTAYLLTGKTNAYFSYFQRRIRGDLLERTQGRTKGRRTDRVRHTERWTDGQLAKQMDGWMDRREDGQIDGQMKGDI